jgi:coronin-1B/1C/6
VPRKSDAFQPDLFPDCPAPESAHTAEQWMAGSSKPPITICLDPAKNKLTAKDDGGVRRTFKVRTVAAVEAELKETTARIRYLENKLKENGISY